MRNRKKRKKVSLLLLCVLLMACMMPQAAFAGSWNEDDEITITVDVFDLSTNQIHQGVGTDTVRKGDTAKIQSDNYQIPDLSKFTEQKYGRITEVTGNWYGYYRSANKGANVVFSCNSSTARITYWVTYFGDGGSGSGSGGSGGDVDTGSGGRYTWNQKVIYHSNYPSGTDIEKSVTYHVSHMVKVYTLSPLKTLDELGFSVPQGFTAATPLWSLTKDGSRPANVVSLNMDQAGTPIHLYARYNEPTPTSDTQYVITYMDGDTKVSEDKVVKGESTTTMDALTKDGFDFKGWTQTKGGSTVDYEAGARITPTGDMTLYAVWEAKSNPQPPTPGGDDPKPPAPPTLDELKEAVIVKCEAKPMQHAEETFALNDADKQTLTKVSDTEYTFSISPQAYADAYNLTPSANGKNHKLSEGQTEKVIHILWDAQSESWKIDKEKTPLPAEFKVACTDEEKPPTPSRPGHTRYIIRWMLEDGTILETDYERYGATPKYDGSTPSKAETDEFTYEFIGWRPEISMVTKDIDYTAVFKAIPKEKEPEENPTQPASEPQSTDTKDTDKKNETGKTEQRNEKDSEVPKTGDQTMANAIFYLILLVGTAGGMTICMLRKPQK